MRLKDLKLSYQAQQTQFITINNFGVVIESDNVLFSIVSNSNISNIHPFFESILETLSSFDNLSFSCVYLEIKKTDFICDIEIKKVKSDFYIIIVTDFSKHYDSFKSLVQSRNETTLKSDILAIRNKLLREKEVFKNKFIANFSHEVKAPIASIISFSSLSKDTKLRSDQKVYLDIITSSGFHLNSVINDILDISKIETGKLEIKSELFNFAKLIEQLSIKYKLKCIDKKLEFDVKLDQSIPTFIESDKTRIRQIIQNLLDNAIKFTSSGSVSLEIKNIYRRAQNLKLSIIVKDTGTGINEKDYDTIFQSFNRLENSIDIEGVGLGLTIVKEIVELMKGDLHIESEINKGTAFTINIKVKPSFIQIEPSKELIKKAIKDSFKNKPKRKRHILLVEDNTNHQLSVFKILAKTKLFYLDIVGNGLDAIKSVSKSNYDVILMDFELPHLNGLEVSKAIRNLSDKKKSSTPIILITSNIISATHLKQIESYFYDIIEKPFEEETLIYTIQKCLK